MNISTEYFLMLLGMLLVTQLPRILPLLILSSSGLNPLIERWLKIVPASVLASILVPQLLLSETDGKMQLEIGLNNHFLLAAIPAFLVAWHSRSFFLTVLTGMGVLALLRYVMPLL